MKKLIVAFLLLMPSVVFAQKNISVEESMNLILNQKNLQIVDVRTKIEYDSTYIKNAVNVDYKNPAFSDNILVVDKDLPVLVYCRSGKRSYNAMNIMLQLGYKEVYNMQGGILAFKKLYPKQLQSNINND